MTLPKIKINPKEWEFEFQQRGEQPILLSDWYCRGVSRHFAKAFQLEISNYDYFFTQLNKGYVKTKLKEGLLLKLKKAIENPVYLNRLLERSVGVMREFGHLADEINTKIKSGTVSDAQLASYWKKLDSSFIKTLPWFWIPYYIAEQNMITDEVRRGLERYKMAVEKITDLNDALLTVVFPIKTFDLQEEQKEFYRLVKLVGSKQFDMFADRYLKKYGWMTTFLLMPILPMTQKELIKRINDAKRNHFGRQFEMLQRAKGENQIKVKRILALLKNDKELLASIKNAQELGYALTAGVEEALQSSAKYLPFLQLVAKRIDMDFQNIKYLLSKEILAGLEQKDIPSKKEIAKRKEGYVMAVVRGKQSHIFGKEALEVSEWMDKKISVLDKETTEIKGQPACGGLSRGKVRIVFSPLESRALRAGEVLVCPMTNPDYVPAMKRSVAIVTDEGGLLSHAAIMSREFDKPCIVGTKFATKVLKDGDLIEVDANKGVVRILK